MSMIWGPKGMYRHKGYTSEAALEESVLEVQDQLFGAGRIYLDAKRKIGGKGNLKNIPDGYLFDLSGSKPRLYVVENELASHEPLRHIAVQILQFSLSFQQEPLHTKRVLYNILDSNPEARARCEQYAATHDFRNLDHLLEYLVSQAPFAALIIIDEMPEDLQSVLSRSFQFGVEALELRRYETIGGDHFYQFTPFLADLSPAKDDSAEVEAETRVDVADVDTVVVPGKSDTFQDAFLTEHRWYAVRIHGTMRPQIKYIAVYQTAPVSAITHIAPVKSIEPWKDSDKVVLNFAEPAKPIGPIPLVKHGRVKPLYGLRYANRDKLLGAKNLDDVW